MEALASKCVMHVDKVGIVPRGRYHLATLQCTPEGCWEAFGFLPGQCLWEGLRNNHALQPGEGLTALRFSDSGLQCAVGMHNGLVALYDLRSSRPVIVKDHNYGAPNQRHQIPYV